MSTPPSMPVDPPDHQQPVAREPSAGEIEAEKEAAARRVALGCSGNCLGCFLSLPLSVLIVLLLMAALRLGPRFHLWAPG